MVIEGNEIPKGWPLGLENMNMRLRVAESLQAAAAAEPYPTHVPSSSFSSFSSTTLDTEINQSTASFFKDSSMSLGRLIGITPQGTENLYFPSTIHFQPRENLSESRSRSEVPQIHVVKTSRGICIPLLLNIKVKMSRSKSSTRD